MEQTTVNRVAELYKRKSELFEELSDVIDEDLYNFTICRGYKGGSIGTISYMRYKTLSSSFLAEIKKLTEAHINQQIEEIDKELEEL
jgi:hypothetical protein